MASDTLDTERPAEPIDTTKLEPARRKRLTDANGNPVRRDNSPRPEQPRSDKRDPSPRPQFNDNDTPQPIDPSKLEPAKRKATEDDENRPRKKRPVGRNRMSEAEKEAIRRRQEEREREQREAIEEQKRRGIHDAVRQHYNAVPERGREWRRTDSRIKGLRSFNNWVKSSLIQKFSPDDEFQPGYGDERGLLVLDMGCGKGGDLGKWQQAPQHVDLYVGLDPAEVSIDQARGRYNEMKHGGGRGGRGGGRGGYRRAPPRIFHGEFAVQDCFGDTIDKIPIVREVGFDASGGPSRFASGKFDVVTMMFCMHYAFESEEKAKQMLRNVAGALKQGGRFIGTIPNSDVLSKHVIKHAEAQAAEKAAKAKAEAEKAAQNSESNGESISETKLEEDGELKESVLDKTAEFGNDVYRVRFAGPTPSDGVFRPPFGWKYNFFLHEAVEEVPEYVVPWEAFRAIAEDFNLEMRYHKTFNEVWEEEKDDEVLGPLSERMGVRERGRGPAGKLVVSEEEMEAAGFYVAFCFTKV